MYGGMNDLKRGEFDNLSEVFLQQGLVALTSQIKSKIIIPTFIGVYQYSQLKPDSAVERQYLQTAETIKRFKEDFLDRHVTMLQEEYIEDSCHPKLIHIGYSPEIGSSSLIKELFGEGIKRIGVSPYQNLPDFPAKDTLTIEQYISRVYDTTNNKVEKNETEALAKEFYDFLENQHKIFGLTRVEYALMDKMRQIANPHLENRMIITDSNLISSWVESSNPVIKFPEN